MSESAAPLRDDASSEPRDTSSGDPRWGLSSFAWDRGVGPRLGARRFARVLIVDDNPDAREMYALFFRTKGYDAVTADDAEIAVEMAAQLQPDVIVMDLAMPGMSGISATHQLKCDPRTRKIPVILLTGHYARAIQEGALERGVDAFLTKPCLPEDLEHHVVRLIEARRGRRDAD